MNPRGKDNGNRDSEKTKALDSASRKLERREKGNKPVRSIGRRVRDGWKEGA